MKMAHPFFGVLGIGCFPSLNTQSCIKGILVAQDFCFWTVWAVWPVQKKVGGRLLPTFVGVFFMFLGLKFLKKKHDSVRTKKLQDIFFSFFFLITL